jgi:hypothetical protein
MRLPTFNQLAALPEEEAVQRHFDAGNYRTMRWLIVGSIFLSFIMIAAVFSHDRSLPQQRPIALLHPLFLLFLFLSRKSEWFTRNFRVIVLTYIVVEFLTAISMVGVGKTIVILSAVFFPPIYLFFRFRTSEYFGLAGTVLLSCILVGLFSTSSVGRFVGLFLFFPLVTNAIFARIGVALTRSERERFTGEWQLASTGEHERRRMRSELDDARKIQLAMLPDQAPLATWIDVSSSSVPATEVGGDFFDYYELGGDRLAIVIGDVAGHGVPSGLVLAAIKSGLFLLRDRLGDPAAAIVALDEMVRDSIRWRMLVSLLIVVLDRRTGRLHVVAAGHPPLLLFSARSRGITRLGFGALPLGTRLHPAYEEGEASFEPGDVLLLATDGVTELSSRGEMFGEERLAQLVTDHADLDAGGIHEKLVTALRDCRGAEAQEDDVTIVVAKIR